jgi:phospholipid/cholesterol/gamma-HCH transport system substrate-binding protein
MAEPQASEPEVIALEIVPSATSLARVALVILVALAIGAALSYLLTGAGTKLFAPHTTLTTLVPDAAGIIIGSEVRLSGIPIGDVSKVSISGSLDPQNIVRIDMKVDAQFLKNIPSDSQAIVTEDNLLGDQFVSIEEGKSTTPISENATLAGVPVKQAADQADLIRALKDELQQADDLVTQLSSPDNPLGQFVLGSKEYDQVLLRIADFNRAMNSFVGPDSQIGPALFSATLYNGIRKDVDDVDKTLASIQKGEGVAGRLFASEDQYNDLMKQLRVLHKSLADVNAGKTRLLHDDAAYRKIQDLLAKTDSTIAALNSGQGTAGKLLTDRRLYDSLNATVKKMAALMGDVRTNPQKYLRYQVR